MAKRRFSGRLDNMYASMFVHSFPGKRTPVEPAPAISSIENPRPAKRRRRGRRRAFFPLSARTGFAGALAAKMIPIVFHVITV